MKPSLFVLAVALLVAGCGTPTSPAPEQLIGPYALPAVVPAASAAPEGSLGSSPWEWVSFVSPVERFEVDSPERYLLTFHPDGSVDIQADCNKARGSYTADRNRVSIVVGPMTLAACPPGSRSEAFLRHLGGAAIYFFRDGNLFIDMMADGGTLQLAPLE